MSKKTYNFQRPLGERRYKKLFVISVEGSKTEPQYFSLFNEMQSTVLVKCLKRSSVKSSPIEVLKKMEIYLRKESLKKTDEAWIVVDKDDWTTDQLLELLKWSKQTENRGFALSNPKFEYWLLLHFEEGKGLSTPQECSARLKQHLPNYKKGIERKKFTQDLISIAITRAKKRDTNQTNNLPKLYSTTVYKLAEKIINYK